MKLLLTSLFVLFAGIVIGQVSNPWGDQYPKMVSSDYGVIFRDPATHGTTLLSNLTGTDGTSLIIDPDGYVHLKGAIFYNWYDSGMTINEVVTDMQVHELRYWEEK